MLKNLTAALIVAGIMTTSAFAQGVDVKSAINDLSNRSGAVRQNAVMILGSSNDNSVVSNIERLAYDSDSGVRTAVCWALGQFKSPTSENILNTLARDSRPEVRQAAVTALSNYKSTTTAENLIRATYDSDINVKKSAINSLAVIKYEKAGSRLSDLLSDSNPDVRYAASIAIKNMNYNAPSSMVASGMRDSDDRVRAESVVNLGTSGNDKSLSLILPGLKDPNPNVRASTVTSLGNIKKETVISYIIDSLSDNAEIVGEAASKALINIGPSTIPSITKTLANSPQKVQELCIKALAGMGEANVDLLSEYSKKADLREIAIWGLGETKSIKAFPAIFDGFGDPNDNIQKTSIEAMGKLGPEVLSNFEKEKENPNNKIRQNIAKCLGYAPYSDNIAKFLIELMKDDNEEVVAEASSSLAKFGASARPLVVDMLKSDDDMQRTGAINALALMGEESIPILRECLNDRSPKVKASAILGLGQMGDIDSADEIVRIFEDDNDPEVKRACAWTIGKICEPSYELMNRLVLEKTRAAGKKLPALQQTIENTIKIFEGTAEEGE